MLRLAVREAHSESLFGTRDENLRYLEERLGVQLLRRTTRRLNLTETGKSFYEHSARILADESLVTFLIVQDQFLTPTARFADLLLPACTAFETGT